MAEDQSGDEVPDLAYDEFSIMRLKEDEAVVSVHVIHGMNEEMFEQMMGKDDEEIVAAEDHALFAAMAKLWKYHRESGWDASELLLQMEKAD